MSEADRIKRGQQLTGAMREHMFQTEIRQTPWYKEFVQRYGEEPNFQDPNYNYREAWDAGVRPDVRDPGDQMLHWNSQFKGPNHPNRFVQGIDTHTNKPVELVEPENE
jgi:hypothetical protein